MNKTVYQKPIIKNINIDNTTILSGSENQSKSYDYNELETTENKTYLYNTKSVWDD